MPVSRQARYLRLRSLTALQTLIPTGAPLAVLYDEPRGPFIVLLDGQPRMRGRFDVITGYLQGYRDAHLPKRDA